MSRNSRNRSSAAFGRASDDSASEDHWLRELDKSLEKAAVQSREQDSSLFDQINSIMHGARPGKHTSVASIVEEMKERSGLTAYLKNINKTSEEDTSEGITAAKKSTAQATNPVGQLPPILQQFPTIKSTINNYIDYTHGNMSVPAILHRVRSIHEHDVADTALWDDENLIRFISHANLVEKSKNPQNDAPAEAHLGSGDGGDEHIDPENYDAFYGLESNIK